MSLTYDDTLPLPEEVEKEFYNKAGDNTEALAWLTERDVDSVPPHAALIQYGMVWTPETSRYRFIIYEPDHIGPKHPLELAFPIIDDDIFIDLLFISDEMSFERATCRASWLGRENLALPVVRLHAHPMDWLESGCTGACHIEPISRKAFRDLRNATTIECNDIYTALEAWDWGFDADRTCVDAPEQMARFMIDDTPGNIRSYFEEQIKWQTRHLARDMS
jgi:hypothetical protein